VDTVKYSTVQYSTVQYCTPCILLCFPLCLRAVPGFTGTLGSVVPDAQTFIGTLFKGVAKVLTSNYTFNAQVVNVSSKQY